MTDQTRPTTDRHDHQHDRRNENDLLTIDEAAAILRTPKATLRYWRHLGIGPYSFRIGHRLLEESHRNAVEPRPGHIT